jgi:hypothetical protein
MVHTPAAQGRKGKIHKGRITPLDKPASAGDTSGMRTESEIVELLAETVLPMKLRIELERHGDGDGCVRIVERTCHFFTFTMESGVDLYNIVAGRLQKVVAYNGVLSIEELS